MKLFKYILLTLCILFGLGLSKAQIGIGTTNPAASAALDITSTTKGFLMPRLTSSQRNQIVNPVQSLIIFNTTEQCIQMNQGSSTLPDWQCMSFNNTPLDFICHSNQISGVYFVGNPLDANHKYSILLKNNGSRTKQLIFNTSDINLSGASNGITVTNVNQNNINLTPGDSILVEYEFSGTPTATGVFNVNWNSNGYNCSVPYNVVDGNATIQSERVEYVVSVNNTSPNVNISGQINNVLPIKIHYTNGVGNYIAFNGDYVANNAGTGKNGDVNGFRLSYPSGSFSNEGYIQAQIEVDGDQVFNVKELLLGNTELIASLHVKINGISMGDILLTAAGGLPDRNFDDPDHKFIYLPVETNDGRTWLNNNLGANYSNVNHAAYNPSQQALNYNFYHAYGSLFQWGRYSDGHELIGRIGTITNTNLPSITNTTATNPRPNHNQMINQTFPSTDWLQPSNSDLWKGIDGINNPCPHGYRVPTMDEINTVFSQENITNKYTAASSGLALTTAGFRFPSHNSILMAEGYYWTSEDNPLNRGLRRHIGDGTSHSGNSSKTSVFSVRCIKD